MELASVWLDQHVCKTESISQWGKSKFWSRTRNYSYPVFQNNQSELGLGEEFNVIIRPVMII